jgi:hypothetical protein
MKKLLVSLLICCFFLISCSKSSVSISTEMNKRSVEKALSTQDTLRPVANGSTVQNYPNTGGTGANAWCAADTNNYGVNNMYLYEVGNGPQLDLYTVINSIPAGSTINSVTVFGSACTNSQRGVTSPGTLNFAVRENSMTSIGATISLPINNSFPQFSETWTVRPSDGNSWTKADIDNLEIGFQQTRPGGVGFTKTGHIYCVVNYN